MRGDPFTSAPIDPTIACISVRNKPVVGHAVPNEIVVLQVNSSTTDDELRKDEYIFLREEMRHEDNLINARLSWLVNSQSFLFGAFAITLNGSTQSKFPMFTRLNVILVTWLPNGGYPCCSSELPDDLGCDPAYQKSSSLGTGQVSAASAPASR